MADDGLTLEEIQRQAAGGDPLPEEPKPNPEDTNPEDTNPEDDGADNPEDPKPEEDTGEDGGNNDDADDAEDKEDEDKKPNPMKEVRDRLNEEKKQREFISNTLNKFTKGEYEFSLKDHMLEDGSGVDYESLNKAMQEVDTANKAKDNNITPEMQAEIDRLEKERIELQKERLQIDMDKALTNLQIERGLKSGEINNFFKDAMAKGKNPYQWLAQGGTLDDLYQNVYTDKIIEDRIAAAVEKARKEWEASSGRRAPTPNPGASNPQQTNNKEGLSMQEMLAEAAKKAAK